MKVAWLADDPGYIGGAEITGGLLRDATPEGIEVVEVPPDAIERVRDCDVACVFNCVHYPAQTARALRGKKVVKRWADMCPHGDPTLRDWLLDNAVSLFCSPLQVERWQHAKARRTELLPPPIDLERFRAAAQDEREGTCWIGRYYRGKGIHRALRWAQENGEQIDFYGAGPLEPPNDCGPLDHNRVPGVLGRHKRFIHLPTALEPFGRSVGEAWASGCELVVNGKVGALHWVKENPDAMQTAPRDFWGHVTSD